MQVVSDTVHNLQLGQAATFDGLTVFPLFAGEARAPDYIMLDEALERGQARVQEVSEGGEVPSLLFENIGNSKVLLVDGDELVGAKQNRVINLSILVAANSRIEIPVSCVEAGRWAYRGRHFGSRKRSLYSRARAAKSAQITAHLRTCGERMADQTQVWDDIAACAYELRVDSPTGSMEDIYEQHNARLDAYRKAFKAQPGQVGGVFAINGQVEGIEYFDSPEAFAKYADRLVGSYAVGALLQSSGNAPEVSEQDVRSFLDQIIEADAESYEALGLGEDLRLSGNRLSGGALVADGRLVHLAAFRVESRHDPLRSRLWRRQTGPVH